MRPSGDHSALSVVHLHDAVALDPRVSESCRLQPLPGHRLHGVTPQLDDSHPASSPEANRRRRSSGRMGTSFALLAPELLWWLSPVLAGLLLSVPMSRVSGSVLAGRMLARIGLLLTPEEVDPPAVLARRDALLKEARALPEDPLRWLAGDSAARSRRSRSWHAACPRRSGCVLRGSRRLHRRDLAVNAARSGLRLRHRRAQRAAADFRRGRRVGQP